MSNSKPPACVILRTVKDDYNNGKPPPAPNRRRASQIVHDDRGNARVEWIEAGYAGEPLERAPLTIENTPARGQHGKLSVERGRAKGFDPYQRVGMGPAAEAPKPARRDLRKLGEWIKLKRELEARKSTDTDSE